MVAGVFLAVLFISCTTAGRENPPAVPSKPEVSEDTSASDQARGFAAKPGRARLVFIHAPNNEIISIAHVSTAVLIPVERAEKTHGIVQRWPGDTSGRYEYTDREKRSFRPSELDEGVLELPPGFYRIEHNTVRGKPPAGMYGRSGIFEIRSGEETEVRIPLFPAI